MTARMSPAGSCSSVTKCSTASSRTATGWLKSMVSAALARMASVFLMSPWM